MQERQATLRGVPMCWGEDGEGFPVVLITAFPPARRCGATSCPRCAAGAAWPLSWSATATRSGGPGPRHLGGPSGRLLLAWLDHLGVEQALLVGHDLGGGVAQITAVRAPRRCAGLGLTNAVYYDSWPIPSVRAMRAAGPVTGRLPTRVFEALVGSLVARGHDDRAIARVAGGPSGALPAPWRRGRAGLAGALAAH